jgi:hypothetical protein
MGHLYHDYVSHKPEGFPARSERGQKTMETTPVTQSPSAATRITKPKSLVCSDATCSTCSNANANQQVKQAIQHWKIKEKATSIHGNTW